MTSDLCDQNVLVQQTLGWLGAYPEKQCAFRDLAETIDMAAVPKIATKQPKKKKKRQAFQLQGDESRDL